MSSVDALRVLTEVMTDIELFCYRHGSVELIKLCGQCRPECINQEGDYKNLPFLSKKIVLYLGKKEKKELAFRL